jgi:hypothetical protein
MLLYEDLGHLPPDLEQLTIWEARAMIQIGAGLISLARCELAYLMVLSP